VFGVQNASHWLSNGMHSSVSSSPANAICQQQGVLIIGVEVVGDGVVVVGTNGVVVSQPHSGFAGQHEPVEKVNRPSDALSQSP